MKPAAVVTAAIGGTVLVGWLLNVPSLRSVLPGWATMKPNVALAFVALGTALWLIKDNAPESWRRQVARIAAGFAMIVGGLTLVEHGLRCDLGVDRVLLPRQEALSDDPSTVRMPAITALSLFLTGSALLAVHSSRWVWLTQFASLGMVTVSIVALTGYLYGVSTLYEIGAHQPIAFPTAIAFLAMGLGLLSVHPERGIVAIVSSDGTGSVIARRLLSVAVIVPFVIGYLTLKGEKSGWYGMEFGVALFTVSNVVVLSIVAMWLAASLNAADRERRRAESWFREAVEASPNGIVMVAADGRITLMNSQAERMFGYSRAELLGQPVELLLPERFRETHPEHRRRFLLDPQVRAMGAGRELFGRRKDGTEFPVEIGLNPLRTDEGLMILSAIVDITQRKRAEEALRLSEERLHAVIESMSEGVVVADLSGQLLQWNRAAIALHGFTSPEEWQQHLSHYVDVFELSTLDGRPLPFDDWPLPRIFRGETLRDVELRLRRLNAPWERVFCYGGGLIHNFHGQTLAFLTITDVTERRRLEEKFLHAQKMEAIGRLAGGIAHDFNNLLTVINGYAELLLSELPDGDRRRTVAEEIHRAGGRAASLTRQLLAFSRRQVMKPVALNLNDCIDDMENLLRRLVAAEIELHVCKAPDLWLVAADPSQIEQVVMNLVINARDAMPQGGKLTIATRNEALDQAYVDAHPNVEPGEYVCLSIDDTGVGMDAATLSHIFDPFFTTKDIGKGTGLGLSTVYGIVRQSGGHVDVDSRLGQGTSFRIYLPRHVPASDERPAAPSTPSTCPTGGGTETILLVEDEDAVRKLAETILTSHGYRVLTAKNGAEAIDVSRTFSGPIALMAADVAMPKMSGPQLAERLARERPEMKVLFLSGYTDDAPSGPLLPKPFAAEDLLSRVRELLDATSSQPE